MKNAFAALRLRPLYGIGGLASLGLELPHTVYKSASNAPLMSSISLWLISVLP